MESIPLEQLALTCQTLRDNRILDLRRENAKLKPKCRIEEGTLYVESAMYKASFILWGFFSTSLAIKLQCLIDAMVVGKSYTFIDEYGNNKFSTDGYWFTVNNDQYDDGHVHEIIVPNECIIPALEAVLN